MNDKDDSAVGYKRPPKHTQFQPGKSGNPSGRPKRTRNFQTELREELSSTIRIVESGQELEVSKQRAIVKTFVTAAIGGNMQAATALLSLCAKLFGEDGDDPEPSADELEIIENFRTQKYPHPTREDDIDATNQADSNGKTNQP